MRQIVSGPLRKVLSLPLPLPYCLLAVLCLLPIEKTFAGYLKPNTSQEFSLEPINPKIGLKINLEYKKDTNITGKNLYPKNAKAYLHKEALTKLHKAVYLLSLQGYGITILDAWRPPISCAILWNKALEMGLKEYYCPPSLSGHTRGVAIDVTLHKLNQPNHNEKVLMPSEFDEFKKFDEHGKLNKLSINQINQESLKNAKILKEVMNQAGFVRHPKEWWHFSLPNEKSFPIVEGKKKKVDSNHELLKK